MRHPHPRRAGLAALATVALAGGAAAPPAPAMPAGGYGEIELPDPTPTPPPPVAAPKPPAAAVYCVTACTDAFTLSAGSATTSTVALSWSGASGYTGYVVERKKTSGTDGFALVATLGGSARDYSDRGLTDNTSYDYRVTATGSNGSASSRVATTRTVPAPTVLTAGITTTRTADLSWTGTTGATGYVVERRLTSSGGSFVAVASLDGSARTYTDGGLGHSTSYDYRVRATGVAGLEASNVVTVRTLPPQVERVRLSTDWSSEFHFKTLDEFSISAPPGAQVLSVHNAAVDKDKAGLNMIAVTHRSADGVTRTVAELPYNATTGVFSGQLVRGTWDLRVTDTFAPRIWGCQLNTWSDSYCETLADVTLEVTWA